VRLRPVDEAVRVRVREREREREWAGGHFVALVVRARTRLRLTGDVHEWLSVARQRLRPFCGCEIHRRQVRVFLARLGSRMDGNH
jgi:hypothetical protein